MRTRAAYICLYIYWYILTYTPAQWLGHRRISMNTCHMIAPETFHFCGLTSSFPVLRGVHTSHALRAGRLASLQGWTHGSLSLCLSSWVVLTAPNEKIPWRMLWAGKNYVRKNNLSLSWNRISNQDNTVFMAFQRKKKEKKKFLFYHCREYFGNSVSCFFTGKKSSLIDKIHLLESFVCLFLWTV